MNTAMVSPAVDEVDLFDHYGRQLDDINSLVEYIDQIVLGNHDDTPEDEDDDKASFFNATAKNLHFFTQFHFDFLEVGAFAGPKTKVAILREHLYCYAFSDVPTPPPDRNLVA